MFKLKMTPHVKTAALFGLTLVTVAACSSRSNFDPKCDFSAYRSAFNNSQTMTLIPQTPGSMANLPLNAVLINSSNLGNKILPIATGGQRLNNNRMKIFARVQNCSSKSLKLQARAVFFDQNQSETEQPTAWTPLFISEASRGYYETSSLSTNADSYLIEIEEIK